MLSGWVTSWASLKDCKAAGNLERSQIGSLLKQRSARGPGKDDTPASDHETKKMEQKQPVDSGAAHPGLQQRLMRGLTSARRALSRPPAPPRTLAVALPGAAFFLMRCSIPSALSAKKERPFPVVS
ncbi:hypothetical protein AAFF_G00154880 [Aldrovandia affinis]|uniref:Uncharacterized protein n=1 Tax=Aldrovandia affinis TaxID=143900 RepID=A0AAD7T064_9TELE|nr:hypothetical protein AAFF_G00154880 [Aldrovandia affinis]